MKKVVVNLNVDPQKFEAAKQFMDEKGLTMEAELSETIDRFYKKYVPAGTRKNIEGAASPTRSVPSNSPHSAPEKPSNLGVSEGNSGVISRNLRLLSSREV